MARIINTDGATRPMQSPQQLVFGVVVAGLGVTIYLIADRIFDFKNKFGEDSWISDLICGSCVISCVIGVALLLTSRISGIGNRILG